MTTPDQPTGGQLPSAAEQVGGGTADGPLTDGPLTDGSLTDGSLTDGAVRLARFKACTTAEDYFAVLEVPYDPRVLAVSRLHILRHFAGQIIDLHLARDTAQSPETVLADYRDALVRSYREFTTSTALDHRLFKVLRDRAPGAKAASAAPGAFVPLAAVSLQRGLS